MFGTSCLLESQKWSHKGRSRKSAAEAWRLAARCGDEGTRRWNRLRCEWRSCYKFHWCSRELSCRNFANNKSISYNFSETSKITSYLWRFTVLCESAIWSKKNKLEYSPTDPPPHPIWDIRLVINNGRAVPVAGPVPSDGRADVQINSNFLKVAVVQKIT